MIDDECLWPEEASVGEVIYPPGGAFGPRQQHNLQLVMIHTGHMTVWVDDAPRTAGANTVCVLFPGHEERFAFAEECATRHSWLHAFVPRLSGELLDRLTRLPWPLQLSPAMSDLTSEALILRHSPLSTSTALLKALAAQMLWRYIGEGERQAQFQATGAPGLPHPAIEDARQFIHLHLGESLTLPSIAAAAAVSSPHLIRLFRWQLNTTPMAYLWEQRVAMGIELLKQTGLGVGEIAERCGFQTSYHFSRRVRQATNSTPLEVRQQAWRSR